MNNHFPEIIETDDSHSFIHKYHIFGMMVMIDIVTRHSESEKNIDIYYSEKIDQPVFVAIDDKRKPIGYILWKEDKNAHILWSKYKVYPLEKNQEIQNIFQRWLSEMGSRSHD